MIRMEEIKKILKIEEKDYRQGMAGKYANYKVMQKLNDAGLLDMNYARKNGPTMKDIYDFMERNKKKDIKVRLAVIDPRRDDFRIFAEVVSVNAKYAKLGTEEDFEFWREFTAFGQCGDACMTENDEWVSWCWYN